MIIKPMLAGKLEDPHTLNYPVLASPKLDGVRCLVINGQAVSRNMKPIPNVIVSEMLRGMPPVDGELIVGDPKARDVFQRTTSGVMSRDGVPKFKFWVFDALTRQPMPFAERLELARSYTQGYEHAAHVVHRAIANTKELLEYEEQMLLAGYEGVMIRDPNGPYKHGRSTAREGWLLKLKRFEDSEAEIIGFQELEHNENEQTRDALGRAERSSHKAGKRAGGTLGSLVLQDVVTGQRFNVGTGFSESQRADIWRRRGSLLGAVVKYRYQPTGVKDAPRFPSFLGFRDAADT